MCKHRAVDYKWWVVGHFESHWFHTVLKRMERSNQLGSIWQKGDGHSEETADWIYICLTEEDQQGWPHNH